MFSRSALKAALFAVLLASFAGCSPENGNNKTSKPAAPLVIFDWSGYELPEFHAKFTEQHPDQPPKFAFFATDEEGYGKAMSGFEFDIVHPCTQFFRLYAKSGLLQPLDTSKIKRWSELSPTLVEAGKVDGVQYFLPYDWGYESILVRTDKVDRLPESWADLWDERYKGHVAMFEAADANHIVTALALGFDPWKTTPEQNEQIKQKLMAIKPNLLTYWADFTEVKQLVASGDVWVAANVWNDGYVSLKNDGVPVQYITPKEGRIGWQCAYAISSKTKNADMAYDYLNALLEPEAQAAFGNNYGYGVSSRAALAKMKPDLVQAMQLDDPELQKRTVYYKDWTEEQRKGITDRWSQIKADSGK
jgi:spermidine/putrescine transport system substrate-binding protein